MEIVPGIYQLRVPIPNNPLGNLNCYLIQGRNGWLMVDTGWNTARALDTLQTGLKELGLTFSNISTVVITHVHPDHFGLAGKIKQLSPKTQLLAHHWESDLIESRYVKFAALRDKMSIFLERNGVPQLQLAALESASMPALQFVNVAFPDSVLYGGEILSTGIFDLEIIWTPGHSPGHISLYESRNRLLLSGDHILPGITPNVSYNVQSGDDPLGDYVNGLHKIENLPVDKVLPAHEEIFFDLRGRIDQIIAHHEKRKAEIRGYLIREPHNAWEIASQLSWETPQPWSKLSPLHKRSAVTEVIAHLESMKWAGNVKRIIKDNQVSYLAQ